MLNVQTQEERVRLWALVDPAEEREERRFLVATGQSFDPTGLTYVGTVQTGGGVRVIHAWETDSE